MYTYHLVLAALCAQGVHSAPGVSNRIVVFPVDYSTWDTHDSAGCAGAASSTGSTLVGRCADIDLYSVKLTPHPPPCKILCIPHSYRDSDFHNSSNMRRNVLEQFWMPGCSIV
ncbi:hypothetical protein PENSPDRAFT_174866 [Peniophora sp. CONT]|nr:hypothetical protein PENSPDRAFT_174866 [Peniophora sp. CONT]